MEIYSPTIGTISHAQVIYTDLAYHRKQITTDKHTLKVSIHITTHFNSSPSISCSLQNYSSTQPHSRHHNPSNGPNPTPPIPSTNQPHSGIRRRRRSPSSIACLGPRGRRQSRASTRQVRFMMQQGNHRHVRDSRVITALLKAVESMRVGLGFVNRSRWLISNVSARVRAVGVCLRDLAVLVVVACVGLTAPCELVVRDDGVAAAEEVGGE